MEKSFRRMIAGGWFLIGVCILAVSAMLVLSMKGFDWMKEAWWLAFAFPLLLFCAILLPFLYYWRKKYLTGSQDLLEGNYWVHWTYEADEWNRFAKGEWRRTKRKAAWTPFGLTLVVVALGYIFTGWTKADLLLVAPVIFGVGLLGSAIMLGHGLFVYNKSQKKVGELYIGARGVYFNESYRTWDMFGARLGKVELKPGDPQILQIEIKYAGRGGSRSDQVRIPIPKAHEHEAAELVTKLSVVL